MKSGEPRDQAEEHDADDAEKENPGHHLIDVDHDVVEIAAIITPAPRSATLGPRGAEDHRDEDHDARGDDERRSSADPQSYSRRRLPHAALVIGAAHVGFPTR